MAYRILADLLLLIHGGFVLFAILGGFLVLHRSRWAWLHVPALLWAGLIEITGATCPLTPLENWLRDLGGTEAYRGDFIDHYLMTILYPNELSRGDQILLASFVLTLNAVIYAIRWQRIRRKSCQRRDHRPPLCLTFLIGSVMVAPP